MIYFAPAACNTIGHESKSVDAVTSGMQTARRFRWFGLILFCSLAGLVVLARAKAWPAQRLMVACYGHVAIFAVWLALSMWALWPYFAAAERIRRGSTT